MATENKKYIVIGERLTSMFNKVKGKIQVENSEVRVTDEYAVLYLMEKYLEGNKNVRRRKQ